MLKSLRIQNYAIIEQQEIGFAAGLNIITGETGAGKSILLGALNLLLGSRADTTVLYNKDRKCFVEAVFDAGIPELVEFLRANDLDEGQELIIRREIAASGKSRAFINDSPVLLHQLRELSGLILDMHQQFAVLELQENEFQINTIDAFAGITSRSNVYARDFSQYQDRIKELEVLHQEEQQALKEQDYLRFQLKEFESLQISLEEADELESRMKKLRNAKEIKSHLQEAFYLLDDRESSLIDQIMDITRDLEPFRDMDKGIELQGHRLDEVIIELRDIAKNLQDLNEDLDLDPQALDELEHQMTILGKLQLKHGAGNGEELFQVKEDMEKKLEGYESLGQSIKKLEKEIQERKNKLKTEAGEISQLRKARVDEFSKTINGLLGELKMENAQLKVAIQAAKELNRHGLDEITYLFAPNKGSEFHPIRKVASGGELSRLSLCIKAVVAKKMHMPTLVFDEIDQGVSGEVARRMGEILSELSALHQVIMITHSPQIAGKASRHFHVVKNTSTQKTIAEISILETESRVMEIAKMLSGDPPTKAALMNAKELISAT